MIKDTTKGWHYLLDKVIVETDYYLNVLRLRDKIFHKYVDGTVSFYKPNKLEIIRDFDMMFREITQFTIIGEMLYIAESDGTLKIINAESFT